MPQFARADGIDRASELLKGKDVLVGAIDVASNEVETPEEVADTIRQALAHVPAERLYPRHQSRHGADALARRLLQAGGAGRRGGTGADVDLRGVSGFGGAVSGLAFRLE